MIFHLNRLIASALWVSYLVVLLDCLSLLLLFRRYCASLVLELLKIAFTSVLFNLGRSLIKDLSVEGRLNDCRG